MIIYTEATINYMANLGLNNEIQVILANSVVKETEKLKVKYVVMNEIPETI